MEMNKETCVRDFVEAKRMCKEVNEEIQTALSNHSYGELEGLRNKLYHFQDACNLFREEIEKIYDTLSNDDKITFRKILIDEIEYKIFDEEMADFANHRLIAELRETKRRYESDVEKAEMEK